MRSFLSVAVAAGLAASAQAAVIFDSQGFEAPAYAVGTIEGQNGWVNDPVGHGLHTVVAGTQGTVTPIGNQMLRVQQGASGTRWSFPDLTAAIANRPLGGEWIWNQFDINVPTGNASTQVFGVLGYNAAGALLGGVRIRPSDGQLVVTLDPDGPGSLAFNSYFGGLFVPRDTWVNLGVGINILTGQLAITTGDSLLFTGIAGAGFATLSDFDVLATGQTANASVFIDNYVVRSEAFIPAPGAAALLGLGALAGARRRR